MKILSYAVLCLFLVSAVPLSAAFEDVAEDVPETAVPVKTAPTTTAPAPTTTVTTQKKAPAPAAAPAPKATTAPAPTTTTAPKPTSPTTSVTPAPAATTTPPAATTPATTVAPTPAATTTKPTTTTAPATAVAPAPAATTTPATTPPPATPPKTTPAPTAPTVPSTASTPAVTVPKTVATTPTAPAVTPPAVTVPDVPKPLDINTLKFKREIRGFKYKSSETGISDVQGNIKAVMTAVLPLIQKLPEGRKVQIIGHADGSGPENPTGDKPGNIAISRDRAEAILDYIVSTYKIDRGRFEIVAKGSSELKNKSNPKSAENRRVVIQFQP